MGREPKSGSMALVMKVNGRITEQMAMANYFIQMEIAMKVFSRIFSVRLTKFPLYSE